MSVNVCVFHGNLTRDPELKDVGETKVAKVGLAVNRYYKGEKKVSFLDLEFWGKQAETVAQLGKKGSSVAVEAEARQDTFEVEGKTRSKVYFTVQNFDLTGKRGEASESKSVVSETEPAASGEDVPF